MKERILGLLAVGLLAGTLAAPANAVIISGTWNFSFGSYSGSFSFTGFDTTQTYTNSTAAGFSVTTNFDTSGNVNLFTYNGTTLYLGGSGGGGGVTQVNTFPAVNDWGLWDISPFPGDTAGGFQYAPIGGSFVGGTATVTSASVPEPGALALLGLGLAGLRLSRRRKAH